MEHQHGIGHSGLEGIWIKVRYILYSMKTYLLTNIRRWTKIKNLQIRALCTWDIWEGHKNSPHLSVFFAIKCSFRSVKLLVENRPNFCSLFRIHIWTLKRIQVWWVFLQYWKECFVNCLIGTWDHWDLRPLRPDVRILILRNMLSCFRLRTMFFIQIHLCMLCVSHLQYVSRRFNIFMLTFQTTIAYKISKQLVAEECCLRNQC